MFSLIKSEIASLPKDTKQKWYLLMIDNSGRKRESKKPFIWFQKFCLCNTTGCWMIMEIQCHAVLFKKRFLLLSLIIFLMKINKKPKPNKQLHVCKFLFWSWKIHCSLTIVVCCIVFVFPYICMEMWENPLNFLLVKQTSLAQWEAAYMPEWFLLPWLW